MSRVLSLLACLIVATGASGALASPRVVQFVQEFSPAPGDAIELWIPTPLQDAGFQTLVSREITGNATVVRMMTESAHPAPFIYARWDKVKHPTLRIVNVVEIDDRASIAVAPEAAAPYLAPTAHVQTDGIVKTTADRIVGRIEDPDQKARAIYDWIVANAVRDPGVRGCGLGDVKSLLASGNLSGKCADLNSLFVGLARASGVPAREVFGQRVAPSALAPSLGKEGDNSKAQHCRAEYYSAALKAWVPVDPADVRKAILEERLAPGDARLRAIQASLFGSWEGTWVAFNHARDFVLEGYDERPLNFFMYPLLASTKLRPDGVDPAETGYRYETKVVAKTRSPKPAASRREG